MLAISVALFATLFVTMNLASAATVSWDRPAPGKINPLFVLDTVYGNIFIATSTQSNIFPNASTTALSANVICLGSDCRTIWPSSVSSVGLATTSPWIIGQVAYVADNGHVTSSATSTPTVTAPITYSGTLGSFVGGIAGTFGCTNASAGVTGCLTGADWTTFNNKQTAGNYLTALTGDVTASGPGSVAATLATVNGNVGSFTNANITVNAKGLITAAANGTSGSTFTYLFNNGSTFGTTTAATSTSIETQGVFFASSTKAASQFPLATSTLFTAGTLYVGNNAGVTSFTGSGLSIAAGALTVSGLSTTNFTSANVSQWTNDAGYLTSLGSLPFTYANFFSTSSAATTTSIHTVGIFTSSSTVAASQFPYASTTDITSALSSTTAQIISNLTPSLVLTGTGGLLGNYGGAAACTNQVVTALSNIGATTCTTVSNAMLANSTIGATSPNSTMTFGAAAALGSTFTGDINLAHSNVWSVLQSFLGNASTTQQSVFGPIFAGKLSTSTIQGDGATSTLNSTLSVSTTSQTAFMVNDGYNDPVSNVLQVKTASSTWPYDIFQGWSATSTGPIWAFDSAGHMMASSTYPTLSSCGTSPSLSNDASDYSGTITVGGVAATACTLTFGNAHTTATHCVISEQTGSTVNTSTYTETLTGFTYSQTGLTSDKLDYICTGK